MWLIVGLGNPGAEYEGTRHNVGFAAVDVLARRHNASPFRAMKKAEVAKAIIGGEEVQLVKPQTYMNLSGDAVGAVARFFKVEPAQVLVLHDELDFSPGEVRLKQGGGHGGNNGIRSIIEHLGREFPRLRIGIGKPRGSGNGADYVLSRFSGGERQLMEEAIDYAADAVEVLLKLGLTKAMNEINRRAKADEEA